MVQPAGEPTPTPGAPAPTPAPAPAAPPAPAPIDLNALPPEVKAYVEAEIKKADEKARIGTKENAAKAAQDELLKKLNAVLNPGQSDTPDVAALTAQLAAQQQATKAALTEAAIGVAARKHGADEMTTTAVLMHGKKLGDLDPSSAEFRAEVDKLVAAEVAANPRLKLTPTAVPPPPAAQGTAGVGSGAPPAQRASGLRAAIQAQLAPK